jgi:hypothetical protein
MVNAMKKHPGEDTTESLDEAARRLLQRLDARKNEATDPVSKAHQARSRIEPAASAGDDGSSRVDRANALPGVVMNTKPNNVLRLASNENRLDGEIPW